MSVLTASYSASLCRWPLACEAGTNDKPTFLFPCEELDRLGNFERTPEATPSQFKKDREDFFLRVRGFFFRSSIPCAIPSGTWDSRRLREVLSWQCALDRLKWSYFTGTRSRVGPIRISPEVFSFPNYFLLYVRYQSLKRSSRRPTESYGPAMHIISLLISRNPCSESSCRV
jgi:hypothetical protein